MHMEEPLLAELRRRDDRPVTHAIAEELNRRGNQFVALLLLVALGPLMLIIAFLVWRSGGGSVLFGHYRVGQTGQLFRCLKFRSMVSNSQEVLAELLQNDPAAKAEWERDQKLSADPRITAIGHFLRRTSLDELPQLLNVVRGEMNLVGPRPITFEELIRNGSIRWHYFSVKPGMTGLWQVSGRNNTSYEERVALDAKYVKERTLWLDFLIILKTVKVVLMRDGAS